MSETATVQDFFSVQNARSALQWCAKSWFGIALTGQWCFAAYVFFIYAVTPATGIEVSEISPTTGAKETQGVDRLVFFTHILPTVYLAFFGLFQLVPGIRNRFKAFHRWNGRAFLTLGLLGAITGLYLQWVRGLTFSAGVSVNGVLILFAVYFCWYYALKKRFDLHQRWAVHTFILVNGVWSFRLYLMGWYLINQGPNGNTANVDGPMDIFLSFASFLLPMAVAEVYFWVQKQRTVGKVWSGVIVMALGATITLVGVIAAVSMMWMPRITMLFSLI